MKKVFCYILSSAVLALSGIFTSCADKGLDVTGCMPLREFGFGPVVGNNSTKGIISGTTFPADSAFNVNAFLFTDKDAGGNISYDNAQTFFYNSVAVRNASGNWSLSSGDRYYWPLSGAMLFMGLYPTSSTMRTMHIYDDFILAPDFSGVFHNYTIKHSTGRPDYTAIEEDALKTEDNLYAGNMDFMFAAVTYPDVNDRASDVVPMVFSHNLSQISFLVKSLEDYSECDYRTADGSPTTVDEDWDHANINHVSIRVDKMKLLNVWSVGEYYTNAPHWKDEDLKNLYSYVLLDRPEGGEREGTQVLYDCHDGGEYRNDPADYPLFSTRTPVAVPILSGADDSPLSVLMIPQRLHSSAELEVTYTVRQYNTREYDNGDLDPSDPSYRSTYLLADYSSTVTRRLKLSDITTVWAIGMKYVYTVSIGLDHILVDAEYKKWNNGETEDVVL